MAARLDELSRRFLRGVPERSDEASSLWLQYEEGKTEDLRPLKAHLHTLKGEAQMLGLERCAALLRLVEEVVVLAQGASMAARDIGNPLLEAFDALTLLAADPDAGEGTLDIEAVIGSLASLAAQLREAQPASTQGAPGSPQPDVAASAASSVASGARTTEGSLDTDNSLRVADVQPSVHELKRLYDEQSRLQQRVREIQSLLRAVVAEMDPSLPPAVLGEQVIKTLGATAELERRISAVRADWSANAFATGLALDQLTEITRKAAVVSVATLRTTLERTARTTARMLSKDVVLRVRGDAHIDAKVSERLESSLLHAVRNAVDHGVELPAERSARGKPAHGTILVTIEQETSHVRVTVEDDGAGVDVKKLRASHGIASGVSDRDALRVLLESGVSTRSQAGDISGRGVGLDVVMRDAASIGGSVDIASTPGVGFKLTLVLPTVMRADLVVPFRHRGHRLAIPSRHVESFCRIDEVIDTAQGGHVRITHADRTELLPIYSIAAAFGDVAGAAGGMRALVVRHQTDKFAVAVDSYESPRAMPFQPTHELAFRSPLVRAAAATPDGVHLLLDVEALSSALRGFTDRSQQAEGRKQAKVVVVEDAPVARELLSGILRSFGLAVTEAADGAEGLSRIRQVVPDLVLTDIEMPFLSGLDMIAQLRSEARFASLPVIVLSTDTSEATRRRAAFLQVVGFLSKQRFVEHELRKLVDGCLRGGSA